MLCLLQSRLRSQLVFVTYSASSFAFLPDVFFWPLHGAFYRWRSIVACFFFLPGIRPFLQTLDESAVVSRYDGSISFGKLHLMYRCFADISRSPGAELHHAPIALHF